MNIILLSFNIFKQRFTIWLEGDLSNWANFCQSRTLPVSEREKECTIIFICCSLIDFNKVRANTLYVVVSMQNVQSIACMYYNNYNTCMQWIANNWVIHYPIQCTWIIKSTFLPTCNSSLILMWNQWNIKLHTQKDLTCIIQCTYWMSNFLRPKNVALNSGHFFSWLGDQMRNFRQSSSSH